MIIDDHKILGIKMNEWKWRKKTTKKRKTQQQQFCNSSGAWEINTICKYET